jgi:hypothetical protein
MSDFAERLMFAIAITWGGFVILAALATTLLGG